MKMPRFTGRQRANAWPLAALCSVLVLGAPATLAAPPPWTEVPYSQFANGKPLSRVFTEFAASFGLGISMPENLSDTVNGRFNAASPTEFLNRIANVYGLTWYTHAGVLYVSRIQDSVVRSLSIPTVGGNNSVRQILTDLRVFEPRFGWTELPAQGVALVTGPKSYADLIERTIAALPRAPGGQQVMMYRLQHAPVDDRVISYRDREITVPGVATVLRNLMQVNVPGAVRPGSSITGAPSQNFGGLGGNSSATAGNAATGVGFSANASQGSGSTPGNAAVQAGSGDQSGAGANAQGGTPGAVSNQVRPRPSIQSDARLNAIIVQDAPDRIPLYTALIAQMDVPAPLIEIEAMIVDVNTSRLEELGIGWGARAGSGGTGAIGFGNVNSNPDGATISFIKGNGGIASPTTAVLDGASRYLVARIRALEQAGDASIQARPSILTSENIGAVIDLSETVFIQTTSERTALVTPVTAGTTLRVTPRLTRRGDSSAIFLAVDIEDGQVQGATTPGSLPSLRKGVVSTEAALGPEESLLIGGYNSEQRVASRSKVPVLGNIPGVGALFSTTSDSVQRRERLFLLKARVVAPKAVASAQSAVETPARTQQP